MITKPLAPCRTALVALSVLLICVACNKESETKTKNSSDESSVADQAGDRADSQPADNQQTAGQQTPETNNQDAAAPSDVPAIPDEPLAGTLQGKPFHPTNFEFTQGDILKIGQGDEFFADLQIAIFLFLDEGEPLGGQTIDVKESDGFGSPHIHSSVRPDDGIPDTTIHMEGYRLQLSFSEPENDKLTGRMYLKLPDEETTEISGTFEVELPDDPRQQPTARHLPFVHGSIDFATREDVMLQLGYIGFAASGEKIYSALSVPLGADQWGLVENLSHAPRKSALILEKEQPARYRHVKLTPGTLLIYARWGDELTAGRWVTIDEQSGLELDLALPLDQTGSLTVTIDAQSSSESVSLLPLDEDGSLPESISADQAFNIAASLITAEVSEGQATFTRLLPGRYRVFLSATDTSDVDIEPGETTTVE